MKLLATSALLLASFAGRALAADLHVDAASGDDSRDGLSWGSAKASIAAALQAASETPEADTVRVAEGVYGANLVVPPDVTLVGSHPAGGGAPDLVAHPSVIDGRGVEPCLFLGPGTDACVVEGFIVTGGIPAGDYQGGGITIHESAATVRGCVITGNAAKYGGGIRVRSLTNTEPPKISRCVIAGNETNRWADHPDHGRYDQWGGQDIGGGGLFVEVHDQISTTVPVLSDSIVSHNLCLPWYYMPPNFPRGMLPAGGMVLMGTARIENVEFRDNEGVGWTVGARILGNTTRTCLNCLFVRNTARGVQNVCTSTPRRQSELRLHNVTVAGNRLGGALSVGPSPQEVLYITDYTTSRSIYWGNGPEPHFLRGYGCYDDRGSASESIFDGGFARGTDILDADPLFVEGPEGGHYLSQVAAGEGADSPAVDAASVNAADVGLDALTTRTDSVPDGGAADFGYHRGASFLVAPVIILRGTDPRRLPYLASLPALPFTDAPGSLTDPALRLAFYRVAAGPAVIRVEKDLPAGAVRLRE